MKRSSILSRLPEVAAGLLISSTGFAQIPPGWEIVEIAPPGTEFYYGPPDINDCGEVVFDRRLWPSRNEIEIMLYGRGKVNRLTEDSVYDAFPRINNRGVAVWSRDLDVNAAVERIGIVRWSQGRLEVISDPTDEYWGEGPSDLNDEGDVVWQRRRREPGAEPQIYLLKGTSITPLTHGSFSNQGARINELGDVVWTQYDFSVSPWVSEVIAYFGGTSLQLSSGQRQVVATGLNDEGAVVWASPFTGVELWRDGRAELLLAENAGGGTINNRGDVTITRWDVANSNTMQWLLRDAQLLQLTDGAYGGQGGEINQRGEVAFESGRFPSYGISLFTKRSFVADLDFDGDVDLTDFAMLQTCFGSEKTCEGCTCWSTDTNGDANIDEADTRTIVQFLEGPD